MKRGILICLSIYFLLYLTACGGIGPKALDTPAALAATNTVAPTQGISGLPDTGDTAADTLVPTSTVIAATNLPPTETKAPATSTPSPSDDGRIVFISNRDGNGEKKSCNR